MNSRARPDQDGVDTRHVESQHLKGGALPLRFRIRFHRGAEHAAEGLLQEKRNPDGADQRCVSDDTAERAIGIRSANRAMVTEVVMPTTRMAAMLNTG